MKNQIAKFRTHLPQTAGVSCIPANKNLRSAFLATILSFVAFAIFPEKSTAQYQLFQKKVENAPYHHLYPAGQGYVLISFDGIALADGNLNIQWRRSYGSFASGTQFFSIGARPLTSSNGFLTAGYGRQVSQAKFAVIMTETDAGGAPATSRLYAPNGLPLNAETTMQLAAPTADGGILTGGLIYDPGPNGPEWYLLKFNAAGAVQWSRGFRSNGQETLTDIRQLPDGSYIAAFTIDSEVALLKLAADGQSHWGARYQTGPMLSASVAHDPVAGGYVVACGASDGSKSLIYRTNAIGDILWSRTFTTATPVAVARFLTVHALADGYLIGGTFTSTPTGSPQTQNAFCLKTNASGVIQWANLYTHAGNNRFVSMLPVPGEGAFFSSTFSSSTAESLLARMDPAGNTAPCAGATIFLNENAGGVTVPSTVPANPLVPVAVNFSLVSTFFLPSQSLAAPLETMYCQTTGTEESPGKIHIMKVFPNPATDRATLTMEVEKAGAGVLQLFDFSGKLLYFKEIEPMESDQPLDIDLTHYPSGCYLLRAVVGEKYFGAKLVKE